MVEADKGPLKKDFASIFSFSAATCKINGDQCVICHAWFQSDCTVISHLISCTQYAAVCSWFLFRLFVSVCYLVSGTLVSSCTTALNSFRELCDQYDSTCSLELQPDSQCKAYITINKPPCWHQKSESQSSALTLANGGSLVSSWSCVFHLNENSKTLMSFNT